MAVIGAAALALPIAACAQQAPASAPSQEQGAWQGHHHRGMMGMLRNLNLTQQQQSQIRQIMQQFRQAHPEGSPPDRQAREQMRTQIMNVLTPQQQSQLKSEMQQMRQRRQDRDGGEPQPESTPQA
jgi:Spy/CpxP family protein refolding chaperone